MDDRPTFSIPPEPMLAITAVAGEIEAGRLAEAELEWWADVDGQPTLQETGERRLTITLRSLDAAKARWGHVHAAASEVRAVTNVADQFDPDAVDWSAGADTPPTND